MGLLSTSRGRRVLFALLYFSEGAPIGFLWWALPVRLRAAGTPPEEVASLLSLLVLPWALKFIWAPAADAFARPVPALRRWILASQAVMAVSLLPLALIGLPNASGYLIALLIVHAAAAATQDIGIDALALQVLPPEERGAVNGWMQVGLLAARALFGGGALLVAERLGDGAVIGLLIAAIWIASSGLWLLGATAGDDDRGSIDELGGPTAVLSVSSRVRLTLQDPLTWLGLAFAATAGAGFKSTTALAGPFLIDRGLGTDAVGVFFALPVVVCMAAGAWLGGRAADRMPRLAACAVFEAAAALSVAAIGWLALADEPAVPAKWMLTAFAILYFAIGLATAASYALFMDLARPRLAATQFCVFMAGINLCESWSTRTLGSMISAYGYGVGFMAMAVVSLAALAILLVPIRAARVSRTAHTG